MSPFRPDRRRRGEDRLLGQKMLVFVLGAVIAMAGLATERDWLIYVALVLLLLGLAMRFAGREPVSEEELPQDDELPEDEELPENDEPDYVEPPER
jgi:hypothetical protein